jgi:DNA-dependent RNA polymerase auxiliary subunit epsilon
MLLMKIFYQKSKMKIPIQIKRKRLLIHHEVSTERKKHNNPLRTIRQKG